jgi:HAD superfamily hydrolase (TIGR01490 family)
MSIAFFDLDKTLLAENSAKLWLKAQYKSREITIAQMVTASYWLAKYHLGFTKLDEVIEKSLLMIAGENQTRILKQAADFYKSSIKYLYRPGAIAAIKAHKDLGHKTSLLTSSFDELSTFVQNELSFDHRLCTKLEVDDKGCYTGKTVGPPCFGKNKILFAEKLCKKLAVSLRDCTFYTDSATDMPLLHLVGRPVAVNPDPHLRARAQLYRWEIVDWGVPSWIQTRKT